MTAANTTASEAPAEGGAGNVSGPLAALRRDFPGWNIFPSSGVHERYWASRKTNREKPDGLPVEDSVAWAMTVDGDNAAQLRDAIAEQEAYSGP